MEGKCGHRLCRAHGAETQWETVSPSEGGTSTAGGQRRAVAGWAQEQKGGMSTVNWNGWRGMAG